MLCHGRRVTLQAEDEKGMGEWLGALQETVRVLPVPTEEVSPAARRQRYSTLQRIKQGFLSKNDTKKKMAEEEQHAKPAGVLKTESSPAAMAVITPAAAKPAPVALESSDSSSSD